MTPIQKKIARTERYNTWKANCLFVALFASGLVVTVVANWVMS